eukprot:gene26748-biopygen17285
MSLGIFATRIELELKLPIPPEDPDSELPPRDM